MSAAHSGSAGENPVELLGELRRLRAHTRQAGRSWWFPLTVFGVLVLVSCPLYPSRPTSGAGIPKIGSIKLARLTDAFGGALTGHPTALAIYWVAALVLGFLVTGLWYRNQGARVGLRRPVLAFVTTGITITAALIAAQYVPALASVLFWVGLRGTSGALVIGITLLVLARLERSWVLALIAVLSVAVDRKSVV